MAGSQYQFKPDRYSSHSIILSRLREGQGQRLLDVGAADGYLAERFARQGYEVTCLEGDQSLAEIASAKSLECIVVDLDGPIPNLPGFFDVIVYADILEHLKNPFKTLVLINRYLARDGIVVISVPNVANIWVRLQLLLGNFDYVDRGILDRTHLRFFTLRSFRKFLHEAGLEMFEMFSTPIPLPLVVPKQYQRRSFMLAYAINAWLARIWKSLFGYQLIGVARRSEAHES